MTESEISLSDKEYQELVAYRVAEQLRSERRWRLAFQASIAVPIIMAVVTLGFNQYRLYRDQETVIEQARVLADRPYVDDVRIMSGDASQLEIVGTLFGSDPGEVEVHYASSSDTETVSITLSDDEILTWSDNQILATSWLGDQYEGILPTVRVFTADGRRSPVW